MQEVEPGILDPREQAANEFNLKNQERAEAEAKEAEKQRNKLLNELVIAGREYIGKAVAGKVLNGAEKVLGNEDKVPWDGTLKNRLWVTPVKGDGGRIATFDEIINTPEGKLAFNKFFLETNADITLKDELEKRLRKLD